MKIKKRKLLTCLLAMSLSFCGIANAEVINIDNQHSGTGTSIYPSTYNTDDVITVTNSTVGNISGYGGNDTIIVKNSHTSSINSESGGMNYIKQNITVSDGSNVATIWVHGSVQNDLAVRDSKVRGSISTAGSSSSTGIANVTLSNMTTGEAGSVGAVTINDATNTLDVRNSTINASRTDDRNILSMVANDNSTTSGVGTNNATINNTTINGNAYFHGTTSTVNISNGSHILYDLVGASGGTNGGTNNFTVTGSNIDRDISMGLYNKAYGSQTNVTSQNKQTLKLDTVTVGRNVEMASLLNGEGVLFEAKNSKVLGQVKLGVATSDSTIKATLSNTTVNDAVTVSSSVNGGSHVTLSNNTLLHRTYTGTLGDDYLEVDNSTITDITDMQSGNDTVVIKNGGKLSNLYFREGNNNLLMDNGIAGSIIAGDGNNNFGIKDSSVTYTLNAGAGDNIIDIENSTIRGIELGSTTNPTVGSNLVTLKDSTVTTSIKGKNGENTFILDNSSAGYISMGNASGFATPNNQTVHLLNGSSTSEISAVSDTGIEVVVKDGSDVTNYILVNGKNDRNVLIQDTTLSGTIQGNVGGSVDYRGAMNLTVKDSTLKNTVITGIGNDNVFIDNSTFEKTLSTFGGDDTVVVLDSEMADIDMGRHYIAADWDGGSSSNLTMVGSSAQNIIGGLGGVNAVLANSTVDSIDLGQNKTEDTYSHKDQGVELNNSTVLGDVTTHGFGVSTIKVTNGSLVDGTITTDSGNDVIHITTGGNVTGYINSKAGDDTFLIENWTGSLTGKDIGSATQENDRLRAINSILQLDHMDGQIDLENSEVTLNQNSYGGISLDSTSYSKVTTGSVTFTGSGVNEGVIDLQDGNYGTLEFLDGYSGNGKILLDSSVYDTGSPTDKIKITDNSTTRRTDLGVTTIVVNDTTPFISAGTGIAPELGIGAIVDAKAPNYAGNDFWTGSEFVLENGQIVKRSHLYELYAYETADGKVWYIQSMADPSNPYVPKISPHAEWYAVGLTGAKMLANTALGDLQKRVGELRMYVDPNELANKGTQLWVQSYNKVGSMNTSKGVDFNYGIHGFQGGFDKTFKKNNGNHFFAWGGFVGKGTAKEDSKHIKIETTQDTFYGGVYGTWYQNPLTSNNPAYLDIIGLYGTTDYKLDYRFGDTGKVYEKYGGHTWALSAEAGKTYDRGSFYIEPQIQMIYTQASHEDFIGSTGSEISYDKGNSLTGRVGLRAGKTANIASEKNFLPYFRVNLIKQLSGNSENTVDGASYQNKADKLTTQIGVGTTYQVSKRFNLYGEMNYNFGGDEGWEGRIGGMVRW